MSPRSNIHCRITRGSCSFFVFTFVIVHAPFPDFSLEKPPSLDRLISQHRSQLDSQSRGTAAVHLFCGTMCHPIFFPHDRFSTSSQPNCAPSSRRLSPVLPCIKITYVHFFLSFFSFFFLLFFPYFIHHCSGFFGTSSFQSIREQNFLQVRIKLVSWKMILEYCKPFAIRLIFRRLKELYRVDFRRILFESKTFEIKSISWRLIEIIPESWMIIKNHRILQNLSLSNTSFQACESKNSSNLGKFVSSKNSSEPLRYLGNSV